MVFRVTVYTEGDGSITLSLDDMDLAVNASSKEASIKALCRDMVEYAEEYYHTPIDQISPTKEDEIDWGKPQGNEIW